MLPLSLKRKLEINAIKNLSIVEFLSSIGYEPVRTTSKVSIYSSPLRKEVYPSFIVYHDKNDWYDFGEMSGGSIIDLVMAIFDMDYKEAIQMLRITLKNKKKN